MKKPIVVLWPDCSESYADLTVEKLLDSRICHRVGNFVASVERLLMSKNCLYQRKYLCSLFGDHTSNYLTVVDLDRCHPQYVGWICNIRLGYEANAWANYDTYGIKDFIVLVNPTRCCSFDLDNNIDEYTFVSYRLRKLPLATIANLLHYLTISSGKWWSGEYLRSISSEPGVVHWEGRDLTGASVGLICPRQSGFSSHSFTASWKMDPPRIASEDDLYNFYRESANWGLISFATGKVLRVFSDHFYDANDNYEPFLGTLDWVLNLPSTPTKVWSV